VTLSQSVFGLFGPLFLQWEELDSSSVRWAFRGCRVWVMLPVSPSHFYGGARRLGVIVWVTGAMGQSGLGCSH
jgi:hypothetical protein